MMKLNVLATGSTGNCYLLDSDGKVVILDAGLRARDILLKIPDPEAVVGCLVTHEHGDHARSVSELSRRGIPVVMSSGTATAIGAGELDGIIKVKPLQVVKLGDFKVLAFPVEHDAAEPMGFVITKGRESVLYLTDSYFCRYTFPGVNYWIVECNYIDDLIEETNEALRRRLLESHMSLRRLKDMLKANDLSTASQIVLVHMSDKRGNELQMVSEVKELTDAEVYAARAGMEIRLSSEPF